MIAAIVLAAGEAARFGGCKQLMLLEGKPLLQHVLDRLHRSKIDDVAVVLGAHADEIQRAIHERVIINPDYARGMSTSLQAGLRALPDGAEAALIVLGDQPFVEPATIDALIDEYRRSRATIVLPTCEGRRGNPVLIDRALFASAMELRGDVGFRAIFGQVAEAMAMLVRTHGTTPRKEGAKSDQIRVGIPSELAEEMAFDANTPVVLVAHDYKYDIPVPKKVLATNAPYVGLLGSRRRGAAILQMLRDDGVAEEQLARVRVPIGLDLGGQTAAETALSIVAEIVAVMHGRNGSPLHVR